MLKIRLARRGKKRQPFYRVVVAEAASKRDGRYVEQIGYYNPMVDPIEYKLKEDRALHWLSVGAQPTEAAERLLKKQGTYDRLARLRAGEELGALAAEFNGEPWPPISEEEKQAAAEEAVKEEAEKTEEAAPVAETVVEEAIEEVAEEAPVEAVAEEVVEEAPAVEPEPEPQPEPVAEVVEEVAAPVVEEVVEEEAAVVAAPVIEEPVAEVVEPEPAPESVSVAADDLTRIEGIGPKIAEALHAAGISSFLDLAGSTSSGLRTIVQDAGISAVVDTWPTQSTLAAAGDWDELTALQDKLDGGRAA